MRIAVVGAGPVGLVTAACLAESGRDVACADLDAGRVDALRAGTLPIHEPGLEELIRRNARERRLSFTTDVALAAQDAEVVFLAVGTPAGEDGDADLRHLLDAADAVGRALGRPAVVVNRSTAPVGTAERLRDAIAAVARHDVEVVANPEFLREGAAVEDFLRPDRVVVGAWSERARAVLADLYAPFVRPDRPLLFMDPRSAELVKYAANALLAARISLVNEVALLCERLGADVDEVRRGVGADRRIGLPYLSPGVGYGGSCLPKDVRALRAFARDAGLDSDLLAAVERVNERQRRLLFDAALEHFGGALAGVRCAVWGLSFKPDTDDLREAPSLSLVRLLLEAGAEVSAYDPVAGAGARALLGPAVRVAGDAFSAAEGADALFLVTEWRELCSPDWHRLAGAMRGRALFDGRNAWDAARAREAGFAYRGVGRR